MKKIALTLLVACLCLEAGCSRPKEEASVVSPTPAPKEMTMEKKRRDPASKEAQERKRALKERKQADLTPQSTDPTTTEAITREPSPSPTSSPRR